MFEWLEDELHTVQTPDFHVVTPPNTGGREMVLASKLPFPPSYRLFVSKFGEAKLYRAGMFRYKVYIYAFPKELVVDGKDRYWEFARTARGILYFKDALLAEEQETTIFGWYGDSLRTVSRDFDHWLRVTCGWARKSFKSEKWKAIMAGPKPFDERECEVIKARRKMLWKVDRIAECGNIVFHVENSSSTFLPYLTLGVMAKEQKFEIGCVYLNVSALAPGQSQYIEQNCYLEIYKPQDVEPFALPEPKPWEREYYWEFKE
jgi:hypothetical protein